MQKTPLSIFVLITMAFLSFTASGQRPRGRAAAKPTPPKPIIFAVLDDGAKLEPIAFVDNGRLRPAVSGSDDQRRLRAFHKNYYKTGSEYRLIFGASHAGSVTVKSSNASADCSKNMAMAATRADKTPLRGLVMGLATDLQGKTRMEPYRRKPTTAEKDEIEILVRAEYSRRKLTPRTLRYHNLTALDLNNDGKAELVGSYWIEIDKLTRGLLFFIGEKGGNGKYSFGYRDYKPVDQASVMSGEIKSVDDGVHHELLLDALDYDGDGTSEVFTYTQSFEGAGFNVYRRSRGKWTKAFKGSNYHCGY